MKGKYKKKRQRQEAQERFAAQIKDGHSGGTVDHQQPKETVSSSASEANMSGKWLAKLRNLTANEIAILALIVTVIIAGIYFFQLLSMRRSVAVQQKTMVISQRAYVFAKNVEIAGGATSTQSVEQRNTLMQVIFWNYGQTWARNMSVGMNYAINPNRGGIPSDFQWPVDEHSRPSLLPPASQSSVMKGISLEQLENVESGKSNLFVYGDGTYQDVFGSWHRIKYCFQFAGSVLHKDGTKEYMFFQGPSHNCADDDCN